MIENERQKEVTRQLKEEEEQAERDAEEQLLEEERISKEMARDYGDFNAWTANRSQDYHRHMDKTKAKYYQLIITTRRGIRRFEHGIMIRFQSIIKLEISRE